MKEREKSWTEKKASVQMPNKNVGGDIVSLSSTMWVGDLKLFVLEAV